MNQKVWYRSKVLWFNALVACLATAEVSLRIVQDHLPGNVFAWLTFVLTIGNAALRVMTRQGLTLGEDDGRVPRAPTEEEETAHVDDDFNGR